MEVENLEKPLSTICLLIEGEYSSVVNVIKRRLYTITPPPGIDLEKVLERISEELRTPYAEVSYSKGKLYVELVGTEAQMRETWTRLRNIIAELWGLYSLKVRGEVPIDVLVREAGRTFPPEALVCALELRGYKAEIDDGVLKTTASADVVIELARRIGEVIDELKYRVRGTAIKRLVAAVAAGLDVDVDKVLEFGLKMRVFEENEEGKIELREEWRRALRKLAVMLKPHSRVGMYGETEDKES